jgi:hypothetical protein
MIVDFGTEAAQFPEMEYINGIFVAVIVTVYQIPPILRMLHGS